MRLLREISAAVREGLDELLNAGPAHDEVDEVTELMEADLAEARSELDLARQDESRLLARLETERRDAEALHEQARRAVGQGDDEAGRELIRRRRRVLRGVEILDRQWAEHQDLIGLLHDHCEELEDKLQELRLRSDFLRTRNRVRALKERYERYQRDYDLDDLRELAGEAGLEVDEPVDEAPRPRPRLEPDAPPPPEPEAVGGRAEIPAETDEAPLRPRTREEPPEPWDRPRRNLLLERERMLREIERRSDDAAMETEIEDELRRLKASARGEESPPAEPAAEPAGEAPDADSPDA